ncbi:MAG: hypothetical protein M3R58_02190 [Pseudomonadota bacterium]|nr:hypothetical protein [Pseudomonadota bacterium]
MDTLLTAPPEQTRYARWLAWGARLGLALLVIGFLVYVAGLLPPHVPIERLPSLWVRPSAEFLRETGTGAGWDWIALAHRGDMLNLVGIAVLASCSIPCLAAVIPIFRKRGERVFAAICVVQIAVLLFAASGFLVGGH